MCKHFYFEEDFTFLVMSNFNNQKNDLFDNNSNLKQYNNFNKFPIQLHIIFIKISQRGEKTTKTILETIEKCIVRIHQITIKRINRFSVWKTPFCSNDILKWLIKILNIFIYIYMFIQKKRETHVHVLTAKRETQTTWQLITKIYSVKMDRNYSLISLNTVLILSIYIFCFVFSGKKTTYQLIISVLRMQIQFNFHYFQHDLCFSKNCHFLSNNHTYKWLQKQLKINIS